MKPLIRTGRWMALAVALATLAGCVVAPWGHGRGGRGGYGGGHGSGHERGHERGSDWGHERGADRDGPRGHR